MLNKKGVTSYPTYSLLIFLMVLVLLFSYNYYSLSKKTAEIKNTEEELLNTANSVRAFFLQTILKNSTSVLYLNELDSNDAYVILNKTYITAKEEISNQLVEVPISSLGMKFCSNYTFMTSEETQFFFNGTCISLVPS